MRDFYVPELMEALRAFGVSTAFDAVAAAVFDHGAAPPGVSDRRFRFDYLRGQVERGIGLAGFGYLSDEIPSRMTRMQAVADSWTGAAPLFLMDTSPAAILGALDDGRVADARRPMVANLGNFHTIATLLDGQRIVGLFEHHTGELSRDVLRRRSKHDDYRIRSRVARRLRRSSHERLTIQPGELRVVEHQR